MRIMIGYDGTKYADEAIHDLKWAGLPNDSEVLIVSVGDLLMSSPELSEVISQGFTSSRVEAGLVQAQTHAARITQDTEEAASRAKEQVIQLFPEWNVQAEAIIGTPAFSLIDAAAKWDADLVVVGSQGRSAIKRAFLGSVSTKVVTDSEASVRVGRKGGRHGDDSAPRVIIGVDGSPAAGQAVHSVGQRVWPDGTEIRLIAVDDSIPSHTIATRLPKAAAMIGEHFRAAELRVTSMLEWAMEELTAIGLRTSIVRQKGDAKNILLAQAEEWAADSIFVGTRDFRNSFERFRLGSVSTAVVTRARCSVEVVRASVLERSAGMAATGARAV